MEIFNDIKTICCELGHFYQSQNDFLDCFSEPGLMKKPGTDIEDGKCTWLACTAMELSSDKQKATLIKCYGKNGNYPFYLNPLNKFIFGEANSYIF